MLHQVNQFYIQKNEGSKYTGLHYSIVTNDTIIATIEDQKAHAQKGHNIFLKFFSQVFLAVPKRLIIESVIFEIKQLDGTIVGMIHKAAGMNKPLIVYDNSGHILCTIHSIVKMKAPTIKVQHREGHDLFIATSSYGATNFSIKEQTANTHAASIQKKSLVYETVKEAFFNNDIYTVHNNKADLTTNIICIAITIAIDLYFHAGE